MAFGALMEAVMRAKNSEELAELVERYRSLSKLTDNPVTRRVIREIIAQIERERESAQT